MDAILAVPENNRQNEFIRTLLKGEETAWLGLNDQLKEGEFIHDRTKDKVKYLLILNGQTQMLSTQWFSNKMVFTKL